MNADIDDDLLFEVMNELASSEELSSLPCDDYSNFPWKPPDETISQDIPEEAISQFTPDEAISLVTTDEIISQLIPDETVSQVTTDEIISQLIPDETISQVTADEVISQLIPDEIISQVKADQIISQLIPDETISEVIPDLALPNNTNKDANQTIIIIPTMSVTGNVSYVLIVKKGADSNNAGELIVTRTESIPADTENQLCRNNAIEETQITDDRVVSFQDRRILEEGEIMEVGETFSTSPKVTNMSPFEETPNLQENTISEEGLLSDASPVEYEPTIITADEIDPNNIHVSHFLDLEKPPERKGVWYACDQCDYTSKKKSLTVRHMRTHSGNGAHICHLCQRAFKTAISLGGHLIVHSGTKPNTCKYCPSTFITSGELTRHIRHRHNEDKLHKCESCDYASLELCKVKRHAVQHSAGFTFKCGYCSYAAINKNKLKYHLRIHTTNKPFKLFECMVCNLGNFTWQELNKHKTTHLDNYCPKYPCKLCAISFSSRRDLNAHLQQIHSSPQPLKCTVCEETFPDLHTFKVHSSTHGKSNNLKCDKCPFSTSSLRYLQNHQILHDDQKLYSCDECPQSFPEMFLLNRHRRRSHKNNDAPSSPGANHKCSKCGRQFLQEEHYLNHMSIHISLAESHPELFLPKKAQKKEETVPPVWEI